MDNELITEKTWWKKNWKWFLPFSLLVLVFIFLVISTAPVLNKEPSNLLAFAKAQWKIKNDMDYPYRNKMRNDLITNDRLKRLKKDEIINQLGQPDRIDSAYLFYRIAQERIGFFPLHTKTLVIKLSNDSAANSVMIHQ